MFKRLRKGKKVQNDNTVFTEKIEPCVMDCPIVKEQSIFIKPELWYALVELTKRTDNEFLVFLLGNLERKEITDLYFPKQTVSPTLCSALPGEMLPNTIGALHSHVGMGAFFSQTDKDHMHAPLEIVINRRAEYACLVETTLDCGRTARVKGKIYFIHPDYHERLKEVTQPNPLPSMIHYPVQTNRAGYVNGNPPIVRAEYAKAIKDDSGNFVRWSDDDPSIDRRSWEARQKQPVVAGETPLLTDKNGNQFTETNEGTTQNPQTQNGNSGTITAGSEIQRLTRRQRKAARGTIPAIT